MHRDLKKYMFFRYLISHLALLIAVSLVWAGPVWGQTSESLDRLFTIRSIEVDMTARSASEARRNALSFVEGEAYGKLLRKITQPEGRARLPEITGPQIQSLISGIEVVDEQSSSRRYRAVLDVRFEPSNVSSFLAQYNVPHVLGTGRGLLVLHAHHDGFSNFIWQPKPETLEARSAVDWLNRIRAYVFPRGELRERAAVTYEEIKSFNTSNVSSLLQGYGVQSVIMVHSSWEPSGVLSYSFYSSDTEQVMEGAIQQPGEAAEAKAQRLMYEEILEQIDTAWREQLLVDTGKEGEMTALIPSTELAVLADVQKRLEDVSLVRGQELKEIGLPTSRVYFQYTGRKDQLVMALRYAGLDLEQYGEDHILKVRK